jgi:hypothetical protein
MKKYLFGLAVLTAALGFSPAQASQGGKALRVSVFGKRQGPDSSFNSRVLEIVSNETFPQTTFEGKTFRLMGSIEKMVAEFGVEGGQSLCLKVNRWAPAGTYERIFASLEALEASVPESTLYRLEAAADCQ